MNEITVLKTKGWEEYELLDSGNGFRLERFGKHVIIKPDPQAIWKPSLDQTIWQKADAVFYSQIKSGWKFSKDIPKKWLMQYKDISFWAELSPFKHTGVFPEQHLQWDFMEERIKNANRNISVLNLFAYTGIASLVCAAAGATVTHVDASRSTIGWARQNQAASNLQDKPIRWILDDAVKFCQREIRRGNRYDAVIMDPPVYGHGPNGETWDFAKSFPELILICQRLLSKNPLFVLINAYAVSASSIMLQNILSDFKLDGKIETGELALQEKSGRLLSTGIFGRWVTNL